MLKKLFSQPLKLSLGDKTIQFSTLDDFEFGLSSRTEVLSSKISNLVKLSDQELLREAEAIKQMEQRFLLILTRSMEDQTNIGRNMRELDEKVFSQDHGWRAIMHALSDEGPEYDDYRRLALVKYVQYLASRQEVIRSIYSERHSHGNEQKPSQDEANNNPAHKETVIFDVTQMAGQQPGKRSESITRIPKGETVLFSVPAGKELPIRISKHRFILKGGSPAYLQDEAGPDYLLKAGRNVIGREVDNDVVVSASYRDVSRQHLIITLRSGDNVQLTDLSAHGTFIPNEYLGIAETNE